MTNFNENDILKNENLKKYCTFKIGGNAKFLYICKDKTTLIEVCRYFQLHNIKFKVIGVGANLLFDDLGFDGAIIVNRSNRIMFRKNSVYVDSGVLVSNLISKCVKRNLSGIECLAGIPSSVGGGITNSLGAFETNLSDFIEYVECYKLKDLTTPIKIKKEDCKFGYRTSIFKNNEYIITRAKFTFNYYDLSLIKSKMMECLNKKKNTQPIIYPSAGSIFKRCEIIPAKVIDELGLKGTRFGDAQISTQHAGFIINLGNATSNDVKNLVCHIQKKVKEETNLTLEPEIEFVEY